MYGISKRLDDEHEVHWGLDGGLTITVIKTIDLDGIILHIVCEPMQIEGA